MLCLVETECVTPPEEKYLLEEDIAAQVLCIEGRLQFGFFPRLKLSGFE